MSLGNRSWKYRLPSIFLTFGIFVVAVGLDYVQSLGSMPTVPVENEVVAPRHMRAITQTGEMYNLTRRAYSKYFYFGNEDCDDTEFLLALENVMRDAGAYGDPARSDSDDYQVNYYHIYYFDTMKMPAQEVESVFNLLGVNSDLIPCLIRVENRSMADYVNTADEESIRIFFFGNTDTAAWSLSTGWWTTCYSIGVRLSGCRTSCQSRYLPWSTPRSRIYSSRLL
jgi:hypothetical protein